MTLPAQTAPMPIARPALVDCWNRIGVRGDGSCGELERHVHCRNCAVYSAAAAQLLDGELPEEALTQWTRHVAQPQKIAEAATDSALLFRVAGEWLALPTATFQEIGAVRPIHSLPSRRGGSLLGLVNVRGELVPCVSLQRLLGLAESTGEPRDAARGTAARLLVIAAQAGRVACPVDEVHGIHRHDPRELKALPATVAGAHAKYSRGILTWQQKSVGLLDAELLVYAISRSLASASQT
jgi:chemotaxis-related protein WspD